MNQTENKHSTDTNTTSPESPSKLRRLAIEVAKAAGVTAAAGVLLLPRTGGAEDISVSKPTYQEQAAESAQVPYDQATEADKLLIDGIHVDNSDNNPNNNTPSEAVMNSKGVKVLLKQFPEYRDSLSSSAVGLPNDAKNVAAVNRDINKDGEFEAVAVPVEKESN